MYIYSSAFEGLLHNDEWTHSLRISCQWTTSFKDSDMQNIDFGITRGRPWMGYGIWEGQIMNKLTFERVGQLV